MQFSFAQSFSHRQSMVVTAQLQQAIKLLQMGNAELREFIESQADENPFVELRLPRPALPVTRGAAAAQDDWDRIAALPDTHRPSLYAHVEQHVERLALPPRQARIAGAFIDA
ncbi:MAG: RNA polymerase sigma-54 factor, partial [Gemmobacter sp.]